MYKSVSAFAPIANPMNCDWGKKAFSGYLGEEAKEKWAENDATELVKKWKGAPLDVLIDVVCPSFYPFLLLYAILAHCKLCRGRQITSTNKVNFFQRTSKRLQRARERLI